MSGITPSWSRRADALARMLELSPPCPVLVEVQARSLLAAQRGGHWHAIAAWAAERVRGWCEERGISARIRLRQLRLRCSYEDALESVFADLEREP